MSGCRVRESAWKGDFMGQDSLLKKTQALFFANLAAHRMKADFFLKELQACANEVDRIRLVKGFLPALPLASPHLKKLVKVEEAAAEFRQSANELYRKSEFGEALRGYNLALLFAPPAANELSLVFANRSALFLETGRPLLALQDVVRAEESGYPLPLRPKLEQRKAKCLKRLGLDPATLPHLDHLFFERELDRTKDLPSLFRERKEYADQKLFQLSGTNPSLPAAADQVHLQTSPERGRHLVTTKAVSPGQVLIVEEPFSKVLLGGLKWDLDHCHHCHRRMSSGLPCHNCVFAFFCNEACLEAAQTGWHKYECAAGPLLHLMKAPRIQTLALRILSTVGPAELHRIFTTKDADYLDSSEMAGFCEGVYSSSAYAPIFHLISHPEAQTGPELLSYALSAFTLVAILAKTTPFFAEAADPEFEVWVAAVLLRHILNLPPNAHSLNELRGVDQGIRTAEVAEYGAGAFAVLSLLNHACDPNVFRVNLHSGRTAVLAIRPLSAGEELLDNYGTHYAVHGREERQRHLWQNYAFTCACLACAQDWPLLAQLKNRPHTFVCPLCAARTSLSERLSPAFRTASRLGSDKTTCALCNTHHDLRQLTQELDMKVDAFFAAHELLLENEPLRSLGPLSDVITHFATNLLPPFIRTNEAQETLKQAFNLVVYSAS